MPEAHRVALLTRTPTTLKVTMNMQAFLILSIQGLLDHTGLYVETGSKIRGKYLGRGYITFGHT